MTEIRQFQFESLVTRSDKDQSKIELATDLRSGVLFDLKIEGATKLLDLLKVMDYFIMLKRSSITPERVGYKDWYANEIIKRVMGDRTIYDQKSDAVKDVLKELVSRRNKLINQIKPAYDYIENNKHRIDQMEKVRQDHWKIFNGPLLQYSNHELMFDFLTENREVFGQIFLPIHFEEPAEDLKEGNSWIEYSMQFSKSLNHAYPSEDGSVQLTNTKPRTDIRVLRRSDIAPKRQFETDERWTQTRHLFYAYTQLLMTHKNLKSLTLAPYEAFNLVNEIITHSSKNKHFTLEIIQGSNHFKTQTKNERVKMHVTEGNKAKSTLSISGAIFYGIKGILHRLESLQIYWVGSYYPVLFRWKLQDAEIWLGSDLQTSSRARYLKWIFLEYIYTGATKLPITGSLNDFLTKGFNGGYGYDLKHNTHFVFDIVDGYLKPQTSKKIKEALNRYPHTQNSITKEKSRMSLNNEFGSSISWGPNSELGEFYCSCPSFSDRYLCAHTIVLTIHYFAEVL